jgi:hypothetical protein
LAVARLGRGVIVHRNMMGSRPRRNRNPVTPGLARQDAPGSDAPRGDPPCPPPIPAGTPKCSPSAR